MDKIIKVEDAELENLLHYFSRITGDDRFRTPYRLRVCVDGNQVKFKVNEDMWTAGFGEVDNA